MEIRNGQRLLPKDYRPLLSRPDKRGERVAVLCAQVNGLQAKLNAALAELEAERDARRKAEADALAARAERVLQIGPNIEIEIIINAVCSVFGVKPADLIGTSRERVFARPRQLAMFFARKYWQPGSVSLPAIGRSFGNRDHTTVKAAITQAERLMKLDPMFAERAETVVRLLLNGSANG